MIGCGPMEYSPWTSSPPETDLTAKNLAKLLSNDNNDPLKVALIGDPQVAIEHLNNLGEIFNLRSDLDFILVAGDLTDRGLEKEFKWLVNIFEQYNKPVLTVVGNHDLLSNGKKLYKQTFGPLNYSFFFKDVKFIMWDNNPYESKVDFDWLESQVNSHAKVVIVSHQPPFNGSLSSYQEARWKNIRRNTNIIASLHGHVHSHSFTMEDKLPIYVVDRVIGSHYGIISFEDQLVKFENCSPVCRVIQ